MAQGSITSGTFRLFWGLGLVSGKQENWYLVCMFSIPTTRGARLRALKNCPSPKKVVSRRSIAVDGRDTHIDLLEFEQNIEQVPVQFGRG